MPGTLNVGGHNIITHSGTSGAGTVDANNIDTVNIGNNALVVDSSGNVGVGTVSPQYKFHLRGADATTNFVVGSTVENTQFEVLTYQDDRVVLRSNDSGVARAIVFETGTSEKMRIESNGVVQIPNLSANSDVQTDNYKNLISTSDARLKNDLGVINDSAINVIQQIVPKYFSWKHDESNSRQLGFFAQDIYPVLPEAAPRALKYIEVGKDENDDPILEQVLDEEGNPDYEWGFTNRPIIAMCVKAIQEQQALIESQQSQIDALTTKTQEQDLTIASLISRIEALENA